MIYELYHIIYIICNIRIIWSINKGSLASRRTYPKSISSNSTSAAGPVADNGPFANCTNGIISNSEQSLNYFKNKKTIKIFPKKKLNSKIVVRGTTTTLVSNIVEPNN